ncbi:MAG TPA: DUF4270 family protein [Chitinophagaceae bacterium]|nr:DUF4270 family protein [Chitinophagaceae bacterium]
MNRNKFWRGSSVIIVLILAAFSCTKIKTTDIGSELIPAVDNITTFDTTLEVITENFLFPDSTQPRLFTNVDGTTPAMVAGYISNDPQFGTTNGSIYFYMNPPSYPYPYEAKDSLYLDSVVLALKWNGTTTGDTNRAQKFDVYQLDAPMKGDSAYRITDQFSYTRMLGTRTFAPSVLNDSIFPKGQALVNQLRIRLSDDFGRELLALDTSAGQPLHRDSLMQQYLRGFAVVPDVAGASLANALMGFNISDSNSYLRIYYRYDTAARKDTTFKTWRWPINAPFANNITRNYTGSEVGQTIGGAADSVVYMQTPPGTYTVVKIPALTAFKALKGNVVIHRAELSMTQIPAAGQNDDIFPAPGFLYIDYLDTVKAKQQPFVLDGFPQGSYNPNVIGGKSKKVDGPGGSVVSEYRFNIPRYVQEIMTRNNPNYPIYLFSPYVIRYASPPIFSYLNSMAIGRVKLGGGSKTGQKMVLRIIYSKI